MGRLAAARAREREMDQRERWIKERGEIKERVESKRERQGGSESGKKTNQTNSGHSPLLWRFWIQTLDLKVHQENKDCLIFLDSQEFFL